jgi:hypothetical protein
MIQRELKKGTGYVTFLLSIFKEQLVKKKLFEGCVHKVNNTSILHILAGLD